MRRCAPLFVSTIVALAALPAEASPFTIRSQDPAPATAAPAEPAAVAPAPATEPAAVAPAPEPAPAPAAVQAPPGGEAVSMVSRPDNPDPMAGIEREPEGPEPEESADLEAEELEADAGEETLEEARGEDDTGAEYNAHGLGVRTGLTIVPTWILSSFLASHANSLCQGSQLSPGGFGPDRGLTRKEGCNWYVGGEYIYRKSQSLDIVASFGYQQMKTPNGYWLDADEWGSGCTEHDPSLGCDLGAADYTEIDVSFFFLEADFIGRATVWKTPNAQLQIGGGGGFGVGILVGKGVFQTPLGNRCDDATLDSVMNDCGANAFFRPGSPDPDTGALLETCTELADLGDFDKCTPVYFDDPDVDQDGDGLQDMVGNQLDPWNLGGSLPDGSGNPSSSFNGPGQFARCDDEGCSIGDLDEFGSRFEQQDVPPVVPVVNLILSMRLIVKDVLGININGGWNTGFYFGGSVQYFFGQGGKNQPREAESESGDGSLEEQEFSMKANNYVPYGSF